MCLCGWDRGASCGASAVPLACGLGVFLAQTQVPCSDHKLLLLQVAAVLEKFHFWLQGRRRQTPAVSNLPETLRRAPALYLSARRARGFSFYGPKYRQQLRDSIRQAVEQADSPQAFLLLHSLGGGTGSGVGTYILKMLATEFGEMSRFCCCISPSPQQDDDVITAPYNSSLALLQLKQHASCVLPVANESLIRLTSKQQQEAPSQQQQAGGGRCAKKKKEKAFDAMNDIVAQMLSDLTSSLRFDGSLNVDIGDLTTNMVPFPGLHFLSAAAAALPKTAAPAFLPSSGYASTVSRHLERLMAETLSPQQQLLPGCPSRSLCLASTFLVRGASGLSVSDVLSGIKKAKTSLNFVGFAEDATKIGICRVPPLKQRYGLLSLLNSCEVRHFFKSIHSRFLKLYKRRAHLHHYEEYLERSVFDAAAENVVSLYEDYAYLNTYGAPPPSYLVAAPSTPHSTTMAQSALQYGVRTPAVLSRNTSHGSADSGSTCSSTGGTSTTCTRSSSSSSNACYARRGSRQLGSAVSGTRGNSSSSSPCSSSSLLLSRKFVKLSAREGAARNLQGTTTVASMATAAVAASNFPALCHRPFV